MSNSATNPWNIAIDTGNTFILPSICFYGIVTNLINIKLFFSKNIKDIAFKYYLINGFSNLFYLILCFFVFSFRCGIFCQSSQLSASLATKVFSWVFYTYIKGIFVFTSIFIQITLGIYRLFIVTNRNSDIFKRYKLICFIFFIVSAVIYTPNLYSQTILTSQVNVTQTKVNGSSSYILTNIYTQTTSYIGKSDFGKWSIITVTILRGYVSLSIMMVIDVYTFVKLKNQIKISDGMRG
jgi:hypothetical protein